jgi:hypothetical protein
MHKPERIISDLGDSGSPYISSQTRLFPRRLGTGYGWRITVWLVKALGYTAEGFAMAMLLEIGIITLSVASAKSLYSLLAMRGSAFALALLSFLLLHNNADQAHHAEIASMTENDSRVRSLESIGKSLEITLSELPATYTTGRDKILNSINQNMEKIAAARAAAANSSDFETLQQSFTVKIFTRVALLLLNVFFAHRVVVQLREGL